METLSDTPPVTKDSANIERSSILENYPGDEQFLAVSSPGFNRWLSKCRASLAVTTYQVGKVLFLGIKPDGGLSVFERTFTRSMGLGVSQDARSFMMATKNQIYRFNNIVPKGASHEGYDAVYAPHQTWVTGAVDAHDVVFNKDKEPVYVNTLFNCIATVSDGFSFKPVWKPSFISRYVPEDRCHLNGLAAENGEIKCVTCVAATDVEGSWREHRKDGGLVIDIASSEIMCSGLSMPHSPRLHQGRLWLLNTGHGELGYVDPNNGKFIPIAFCPGFARGLTLIGNYAVVAVSKARKEKTFEGLPLTDALKKRNLEARCGLMVYNLKTGELVESVDFEGVVSELYDVSFLPNAICPMAIGLEGEEINTMIAIDHHL